MENADEKERIKIFHIWIWDYGRYFIFLQ